MSHNSAKSSNTKNPIRKDDTRNMRGRRISVMQWISTYGKKKYVYVKLKKHATDHRLHQIAMRSLREAIVSSAGFEDKGVPQKRAILSELLKRHVEETKKIIHDATRISGSLQRSSEWFLHDKIPALNNETASNLVLNGRSDMVHAYIRHVSMGGFA